MHLHCIVISLYENALALYIIQHSHFSLKNALALYITLTHCMSLTFILKEGKNIHILHGQYRGCWLCGNVPDAKVSAAMILT